MCVAKQKLRAIVLDENNKKITYTGDKVVIKKPRIILTGRIMEDILKIEEQIYRRIYEML